jgi:AraC family transcriptional regulator
MLTNHQSIRPVTPLSFGSTASPHGLVSRPLPEMNDDARFRPQPVESATPVVDIAPNRVVARRALKCRGMSAEFVQATAHDRVQYSFRSPMHLLAAYQQGSRLDGESYVQGAPVSKLRDVSKKLTFVPANHEYREWHEPRTLMGVTYVYLDPAVLQSDIETDDVDVLLSPRLLFEDAAIWSTVSKLKQAIDAPDTENRLYVEALGLVLGHELIRLNRGKAHSDTPVRGGLAAWQQRVVTGYVEEHLAEPIALATLAGLVRLSTYHFCRAFKQSFGIPPHRYHTSRRVEEAKVMLASRKHSVTEIGLALGFSETSSFTAAFRKITGQTPSSYQRSLD